MIDNSKKKVVNISNYESDLYNMVNKQSDKTLETIIDGDDCYFYIQNNILYMEEFDHTITTFSDLDTSTQSQILNQVKEQINE